MANNITNKITCNAVIKLIGSYEDTKSVSREGLEWCNKKLKFYG